MKIQTIFFLLILSGFAHRINSQNSPVITNKKYKHNPPIFSLLFQTRDAPDQNAPRNTDTIEAKPPSC